MQVSVEQISGRKVTVVRYTAMPMMLEFSKQLFDGSFVCFFDGRHVATALPALPKRPTPEDAGLLYRYASEGLFAVARYKIWNIYGDSIQPDNFARGDCVFGISGSRFLSIMTDKNTHEFEITHAVDKDGQRVNVAIEGV